MSNVRQIAHAMLMYVDDHGGHYPPQFPDFDPGPPGYPCKSCRTADWRAFAVYSVPELGSTNLTNLSKVFICPSDNGIPQNAFPDDPMNRALPRAKRLANFYGSSYCFYAALTRLGSDSALPEPGNTFMGGEIWTWHRPGPASPAKVHVSYAADGQARLFKAGDFAEAC